LLVDGFLWGCTGTKPVNLGGLQQNSLPFFAYYFLFPTMKKLLRKLSFKGGIFFAFRRLTVFC
jgi:hypothetical protein